MADTWACKAPSNHMGSGDGPGKVHNAPAGGIASHRQGDGPQPLHHANVAGQARPQEGHARTRPAPYGMGGGHTRPRTLTPLGERLWPSGWLPTTAHPDACGGDKLASPGQQRPHRGVRGQWAVSPSCPLKEKGGSRVVVCILSLCMLVHVFAVHVRLSRLWVLQTLHIRVVQSTLECNARQCAYTLRPQ